MLYDNPSDKTYNIDKIDINKLDYSVESLEEVHKLLDTVDLDKIGNDAYAKLVLRTGAYVGEVYRRKDNSRNWQWLSYEQILKKDRKLMKNISKSLGTAVVLSYKDNLLFPLGKVQKYLANGKEDSLRSFVESMYIMMNQNVKTVEKTHSEKE